MPRYYVEKLVVEDFGTSYDVYNASTGELVESFLNEDEANAFAIEHGKAVAA